MSVSNLHIESRLRLAVKIKDRADALLVQAEMNRDAAHGRAVKELMQPSPPPSTRILEATLAMMAVDPAAAGGVGANLFDAEQSLQRATRVAKRAKRIFYNWHRMSKKYNGY